MKRVIKLAILGLLLSTIIWGYLFWKGGIGTIFKDLGITVVVKVNSDGTAIRNVRICGPPAVVEYMPMLLGLVKDKWEVIQNSKEPGKLILEMKENISGEDKSWNLSTVKIQSSGGLFHRTVSYTEVLSAGNTFEYSTFSKNSSENSGSIIGELEIALDETKVRLIKAAIAFARSVPICVTVEMPGKIVKSSDFEKKSRNVAYFEGKYNDFVEVGKFQIISKSLTPVCGRGAILLAVILLLGMIGCYLYRRFTFWSALREDSNGLYI